MFQTARMRKLKIITLDKYSNPTVRSLHEAGVVQINDISERIQQDPKMELLQPSKATNLTSKLSSLLMKTSGLCELLGDALSEDQGIKDMIKSFVSPVVPKKKEVEDLTAQELIEKAEDLLSKVESKTKVIEDEIAIFDSKKSELKSNKSLAKKMIDFDIDLALLNETKYTSAIIGRIDTESAEKFKKESANVTDKLLILEAVEDKLDKILVVVTLKEFKDEIYSLLRSFNFEKFENEGLNGKPEEIIKSCDLELEAIKNKKSQSLAKLKEIAEKWDDDVVVLKEQLEIEKERNEIFATFGETEKTILLEAWVPLKQVDEVESLIDSATDGSYVVEVEDVGEDDSDVPVLQNNPKIARPYEFLVGMYSPVKYKELDPTFLVFIMFPFFFGYCLTDAFYGIILVILGIVLIKGIGKVNETMGSMGQIITACGLWTIVLGLLTNGFLGDFSSRFLGVKLPTVLPAMDAFVHPENILIIALIIGIVHLNVGFIIGIINNFRYGEKKEALGSQIVWLVLEAGIAFLALGFLVPSVGMIGIAIGGVIIAAAFVILIYCGGVYGIMDVFSYMGNILSYARLLALCLATGGIAMTVNILSEMLYTMIPVPVLGVILAIVIFIAGHFVNFLFQVLGAFINALRLHYVEFFSQFFMGGKNKFETFGANRILTKLKR